ncbi:hypothetical protein chiPu_0000720 [Chiloscyllium punctatum]|uniref:Uncharacterized protein n=1 Tax=Chiloscyllium punctatum TaxID=137246 RepID=A0A401RW36_CHIPU|nr:hypothetical protein [Chiloscyllium punctatum]
MKESRKKSNITNLKTQLEYNRQHSAVFVHFLSGLQSAPLRQSESGVRAAPLSPETYNKKKVSVRRRRESVRKKEGSSPTRAGWSCQSQALELYDWENLVRSGRFSSVLSRIPLML